MRPPVGHARQANPWPIFKSQSCTFLKMARRRRIHHKKDSYNLSGPMCGLRPFLFTRFSLRLVVRFAPYVASGVCVSCIVALILM